jgi:hypothetical protein
LVKAENIENGTAKIWNSILGLQQSMKKAFSGGYPVGVTVGVGVLVGVSDGVKVIVFVRVVVTVFVGVWVWVSVFVGVWVGVSVLVEVILGVGLGVGGILGSGHPTPKSQTVPSNGANTVNLPFVGLLSVL